MIKGSGSFYNLESVKNIQMTEQELLGSSLLWQNREFRVIYSEQERKAEMKHSEQTL